MKAIITGSGFEAANLGQVVSEHMPQSSLGDPSSKILELEHEQTKFLWLRRHGEEGAIAPHRINYRANIYALAELGVTQIVAVNSVGGISEHCEAGSLVIPDQIIDMSWGRDTTFFDGDFLPLKHIDFTFPIDLYLAQKLKEKADEVVPKTTLSATYVCTQGPRLETFAEIDAFARLGADVVGMTLMPEAVLARELEIPYVSLCPVVNSAAGRSGSEVLSEEQIRKRAEKMVEPILKILKLMIQS